jgi:hypothetical protein
MKHYQVIANRKRGYYKVRGFFGDLVNELRGDYTHICWITFKGKLIV